MALSSLLALIDDIASVLDDVALLSKVAAQKTAGVLGDDLALNAQQVAGVSADRELPVVWAVAKGSLVNKAILVPTALAISAMVPWLVTPLLMVGGAYLCLEGFEKLAARWLHAPEEGEVDAQQALKAMDPAGRARWEKDKIKGAIRTDFILSAEIITITLGTVADAGLVTQLLVLAGVAVLMTVGVYGVVAGIVKLDDLGLWLGRQSSALAQRIGRGLVQTAPWLMKFLAVAGTIAMFLVGGGILVHGWPLLHHAIEGFAEGTGGLSATLLPVLANGLVGVACGALVLLAVSGVRRLLPQAAA